jgi:nucleoside-diphosphate-sugar epimerase
VTVTDTAAVKSVLVTGAAGRLGRATLTLLAARGISATGLDLHAVDDVPLNRMVVGEVTDPVVVRDAFDGVEAVIHCAAIPAPTLGTPERVFGVNSLGTFVVLEAAAQAGVGRAVLAGSQSIFGFAFATVPLAPAYFPIDADHPVQPADPYALSKQADEATGEMMARRYGMTVVTLRFPTLGGLDERLPTIAARYRDRPQTGAGAFWAYLEDRDAARAAWLATITPLAGARVFHVAAPETLAALPTEQLLDRWYPHAARRSPMPGRTVPLDIEPAARVLGFQAEYLYPTEPS